ncbi:glutaredoxin domain-containing cysteine-rich protein 1 [Triplophysa dalaica]|uniref:glutaredoxin domain-containing cysteine-rich protein 1 n=1 Tax=Triplophysa dalaica TaxID=1582913 RepID=UPI0024DFB055|nr:glutaredoxin domain-containing cysteine-rich protein 1 [Triplophysa dalaica]
MFNGKMERRASRAHEEHRAERRVRFRVASAHSGRVLQEVFREDALEDSADTDTTVSSEPERASSPAISEANSHLSGLVGHEADDSGSEPDELLMYASVAKEKLFTGKRVNIFSKNGTIRGVRDKVSAGQVLFNNLSKVYGDSLVLNRLKDLEQMPKNSF